MYCLIYLQTCLEYLCTHNSGDVFHISIATSNRKHAAPNNTTVSSLQAMRNLKTASLSSSELLHPEHSLRFLSQDTKCTISCSNVYLCPLIACPRYSKFRGLIFSIISGLFPILVITSTFDALSIHDILRIL